MQFVYFVVIKQNLTVINFFDDDHNDMHLTDTSDWSSARSPSTNGQIRNILLSEISSLKRTQYPYP
jgi:hypothetical protein